LSGRRGPRYMVVTQALDQTTSTPISAIRDAATR